MPDIDFTNLQARRFLLARHGLIGDYRFKGRSGVLAFVRQAGCIQFDPIDVCGKNAELVLQSRVKGFQKSMLAELLYQERSLVDYFEKNLAIIPTEDWKYYGRERERHLEWERSHADIARVHDLILDEIARRGPLCAADLDVPGKVDWYWSATTLARAALEHMYFCGELAVHHKKGTQKYYDLIGNCLPSHILAEPEPWPSDSDHIRWRVLQRIGSVGLMWNRPSDAWLCIPGFKAREREEAFSRLLSEGQIIPVHIEGLKHTCYCRAEDEALAGEVKSGPGLKSRCEFIAPLDNMLWDRKLIQAIFGFEYRWEIYTPKAQRKYGYYVLPILLGDQFIGRIEAVYDKKERKLEVRNLWQEPDTRWSRQTKGRVSRAVDRLEAFNQS